MPGAGRKDCAPRPVASRRLTAGKSQLALCLVAVALASVRGWAAEPPGTALELLGKGVQIYTCSAGPAGAAWNLKAPEATLRDSAGHVVGQQFAGPTWQATDGSKVVGVPLVASVPRGPASIPWLVLRATENDGSAGMFARVAYIVRSRTIGGTAPLTGCDPGHAGAEIRVPYSAIYTFFTPSAP
jgi:Protein of unknown function (DUF3455)